MNTVDKLEVLLFIKGEMVSKEYLCKVLGINEETLLELTDELKEKYLTHPISILTSGTEIGFVTNSESASFVEEIEKKEKGGELSRASLETLAIILYKNGATRSDIDYVRGVNSSFILRNLYLRGLIERKEKEGDSRTFIYTPTSDLLRFLGLSDINQLPDFAEFFESINQKTNLDNANN